MNRNNLIYMLEDDVRYRRSVSKRLAKEKFNNVVVFEDEKDCLSNMNNRPEAVIMSSHLKNMSGLQFIQKAKLVCPDFFVILISGDSESDLNTFVDDRYIRYVDKFIIKGMDDMNELVDALS